MKPMPQGACAECDALWREFAHATAEHVKLLMDSQTANVRRETVRSAHIEELIPAAAVRRAEVRNKIHAHEIAAHADGAKA